MSTEDIPMLWFRFCFCKPLKGTEREEDIVLVDDVRSYNSVKKKGLVHTLSHRPRFSTSTEIAVILLLQNGNVVLIAFMSPLLYSLDERERDGARAATEVNSRSLNDINFDIKAHTHTLRETLHTKCVYAML